MLDRAIQAMPDGHASLPTYLNAFANTLWCRARHKFQSSPQAVSAAAPILEPTVMQDLLVGMAACKAAATTGVGTAGERLLGAHRWALALRILRPQSPDLLVALDTALDLLTLIGGLEQTIRTRHIRLQESSGTALEAAAIACSIERPDKALEWLEQGRCLVWNQINHLRMPIESLHAYNPNMAERIIDVSKRLERAGASQEHSHMDMPSHQKLSLQEEASAHANLAKQRKKLLHHVRATPGFESFLRPAKCATLLHNLPKSGPIVIITAHKERCDAIALLAGLEEPLHIPLPRFSEGKAKQYQRDLGSQLKSRGLRMRRENAGAHGDPQYSGRGIGGYQRPRGTPVWGRLRAWARSPQLPIISRLGRRQRPGDVSHSAGMARGQLDIPFRG